MPAAEQSLGGKAGIHEGIRVRGPYIGAHKENVCTYITRTSARVGQTLNKLGAAMEFFPQCCTACNAHSSERCLSNFCALCFLQLVLHASADIFGLMVVALEKA